MRLATPATRESTTVTSTVEPHIFSSANCFFFIKIVVFFFLFRVNKLEAIAVSRRVAVSFSY